jgi:hypothetical protein
MSMCLALCTLSDQNIRKVLADPPLIWKVLSPDDPEPYENARKERAGGGFLSRLFGRNSAPVPPAAELELTDGEGADTDLDKSWHGIHYMLTQTAWEGAEPLSFLLTGGDPVGNIDVGYGPARALAAEQVQAFHAALQPIDEAFLKRRFNPAEMMKLKIYPEIWDRDPAEDDSFGYCAEYFGSLKSFVADAAKRRLGLLVYIS